VQVLRTYPARHRAIPFAPDGERSIARAYIKALGRARSLVYIEDQYLWGTLVADTLAAALRSSPELRMIIVVPRHPDRDGRITGRAARAAQWRAINNLVGAGGPRVAVYDLENEQGTPIYVHAKVCTVDDQWMTIGSDNLNLRSWTHDSELTCAVVDPDGELPRSLRTTLWAEHLGLAEDDPRLAGIDDPMSLWTSRVGAPGSRIHVHEPEELPRRTTRWARPAYRLLCDPDGRPRRLRGTSDF
jgi:phosphatidylserine/phosphatidylglycerophosphate/cardiolipin synthase-like enzyme